MRTIYADVLVVINTYINFAMLLLTGFIGRERKNRIRLFLSAALGGVYSLVILFPEVNGIILFISKSAVTLIMIFTAFGFHGFKAFMRNGCIFTGIGFAFAGIMLGVYYFFAPKGLIYNNTAVYFDIDTKSLLIFTVIAYCAVKLFYFMVKRKSPKGSLYTVEIQTGAEKICLKGLSDTGNSLKDWFTSYPVIVIDGRFKPKEMNKERLIPFTTVYGEGCMTVFSPDRVIIKGIDRLIETEQVMIGISTEKILNGDFEAIIPYELLER